MSEFINIRVVSKDDVIQIIIEEVNFHFIQPSFPTNLKTFALDDITLYIDRLDKYVILHDIKSCINSSLLKKIYKPRVSSIKFNASLSNNSDNIDKYVCTTYIFELPKIPHLITFFLCLMNIVISRIHTRYYFFDESIAHFLNKKTLKDDLLKEHISGNYNHRSEKCLKKIISIILTNKISSKADNEIYENLSITYNLYKDISFINLQTTHNQDKHLHGGIGKFVLNKDIPQAKRINIFLSYVQLLIQDGQTNGANYIISIVNCMAKRRLFKPCINQVAHDKDKYTFAYIEWDFLREANFNVLEDGRISIDVTQNEIYLRLYAPGKKHFSIFKDEMLHLAKLLNLEFDIDTDFEKTIIFTRHCSRQLKELGLHLNTSYIKKLLIQKNHISIFSQAYKHPDNNLIAKHLPMEIAEAILRKVEPGLDGNDLHDVFDAVFANRI